MEVSASALKSAKSSTPSSTRGAREVCMRHASMFRCVKSVMMYLKGRPLGLHSQHSNSNNNNNNNNNNSRNTSR